MSPVESLNAYYENYADGILKISVQNIQRLPIEIIGIGLGDDKMIVAMEKIIIEGKKPLKASDNYSINFNCKNFNCSKDMIEQQKIYFKILGQQKTNSTTISPFYSLNNE